MHARLLPQITRVSALDSVRRPAPERSDQMAFLFRLQTANGAPAEPPKLESAVPNWRAGHTIPLAGPDAACGRCTRRRRRPAPGVGRGPADDHLIDLHSCVTGPREISLVRTCGVASSASSALRANGHLGGRSVCAVPAPCGERPPPRWRKSSSPALKRASAKLPTAHAVPTSAAAKEAGGRVPPASF
jgi:hypothetical protein